MLSVQVGERETVLLSSVEEVESFIQNQIECESRTKFSVLRTQHASFGKTPCSNQNEEKENSSKSNCEVKKILFDYDDCPYVCLNRRDYQCQNGADCNKKYNQKRENRGPDGDHNFPKKRRVLIQNTKKFDCPVLIKVFAILMFPEHKIKLTSDRQRKKVSSTIRNLESWASGIRKFRFQVPRDEDHKNHVLGEGSGMMIGVDKRIRDKIHDLVTVDGIRKVRTIKKLINHYLRNDLFDKDNVPPISDRRFHPTNIDITNHIQIALAKARFSKFDQENLDVLIKKWKVKSPDDRFFFQPYKTIDENGSQQNFMFIHQTQWQQRMLLKYGSELVLLDATYKTSKYNLPLFFLCVRTNAGYCVVAEFITQDEFMMSIGASLKKIQEWNPSWKPQFFMTDFDEAEIGAVETVFSGGFVYICDFHREQAWVRWCSATKNGVSGCKDEVLSRLRRVARANSVDAFNEAVEALKDSNVFKSNQSLQNYVQKTWLPQYKRWVWAFRKNELTFIINTNNGIERQNENFKYNYLQDVKKRTMGTLSSTITVLIEEYLPEQYQRYIQINTSSSEGFKKYNENVPKYLHSRPRDFVTHSMERLYAAEYAQIEHITLTEKTNIFKVKSSSNPSLEYIVNFGSATEYPHCLCLDFEQKLWLCKHFFAVIKLVPQITWMDLSSKFRLHPLINLDTNLIFQSSTGSTDTFETDNATITTNEEQIEMDFEPMEIPMPVKSVQSEGARCRELLAGIKTFTYLVHEPNALMEVRQDLENVYDVIKSHSDFKENGLVVNLPKTAVGPKFDALKIFKGKQKHPFSNRVGEHAENMRRQYRVNLDISACTDVEQQSQDSAYQNSEI